MALVSVNAQLDLMSIWEDVWLVTQLVPHAQDQTPLNVMLAHQTSTYNSPHV